MSRRIIIGTALSIGFLLNVVFLYALFFKAQEETVPVTLVLSSTAITEEQRRILYEGATETPFTSELLQEKRPGTYVTADCGEPVFRSEQKFDSGTGWPSFWAPMSSSSLVLVKDRTLFIERTEVRSSCGEHLGHVFEDGPEPTGLRYCINGKALRFIADEIATTTR